MLASDGHNRMKTIELFDNFRLPVYSIVFKNYRMNECFSIVSDYRNYIKPWMSMNNKWNNTILNNILTWETTAAVYNTYQ